MDGWIDYIAHEVHAPCVPACYSGVYQQYLTNMYPTGDICVSI